MKPFLNLALLLALVIYLCVAFSRTGSRADEARCTALHVVIDDSAHAGFITPAEVERILRQQKLYPVGRRMEDVDGWRIEQALKANSFVAEVVCYKTPGGRVNVQLSQRLPVMRVMPNDGADYYIDERGHLMKPEGYHADLVVASGHITPEFAARRLVHLAREIHYNAFASDLVQQVYVEADSTLTLVPRLGCRYIRYGRVDSATVAGKFRNLRAFYAKVLPQAGWNTYREVSVEYANQIICKKK